MSVQVAQGSLLKGIDSSVAKALRENKNKEPEPDLGGRLPAGIEGGVAQLRNMRVQKIKEGKDNAGKLMFYADAVMQLPAYHKGVRVRGMQTRVVEMLFDTPKSSRKTATDHFVHVQELIKRVCGVRGDALELENIEATMAACARQRSYFGVRTWRGNKEEIKVVEGKFHVVQVDPETGHPVPGAKPKVYRSELEAKAAHPFAGRDSMVQEQWGAKIEDYVPEAAVPDVPDHTLASASPNGVQQSSPTPTAGPSTVASDAERPFDEFAGQEDAAVAGPVADEDDLDALVTQAVEDDGDAQQRLQDLAKEVGIDQATLDNDDVTWEDVRDMIVSGREEAENTKAEPPAAAEPATPAEPVEVPKPAVGKVWKYKPTGAPKAVKCEVKAVDGRKKTADLKSLINPRQQWKAVPWAEMTPI